MIRRLVSFFMKRARRRRAKLFWQYCHPTPDDKILDLGSGDGSYFANIVPFRSNTYIADVSAEVLARGEQAFGFSTALLDQSRTLPFPDRFFDIVFCNSVIEHVAVAPRDAFRLCSTEAFRMAARERQRAFANEIRRISKRFFVQTPNRYFPVESHTWLPAFMVFLPRREQVRVIRFLNKWWVKTTIPNWHLLTKIRMQELFPDARIVLEKFAGLTKSIIAIRA